MKNHATIESLESRIAPATILPGGKVVTYTDIDGDAVTVKTTLGTFTLLLANGGAPGDNFIFTAPNAAGGQVLHTLDLRQDEFRGTNLTVSVVQKGGGDGLATVGTIEAAGIDLGVVSIKGDLGKMTVGDAATDTGFGLKSLVVQSLGRYGFATGSSIGGQFPTTITGALGSLVVKGDVATAWLHVIGATATDLNAKIGSITIGGSLIGDVVVRSGTISAIGDIGAVKIGRDLVGGTAVVSGVLQSDLGKIKSVSIGGSLIGGADQVTGAIRAGGGIGSVVIKGDVRGGADTDSGVITGVTGAGGDHGNIGSVTIGGSLIRGASALGGMIRSLGDLGPVKIRGDVRGGEIETIADGAEAPGKIASLTISGSIMDGAQIAARGAIGAVKIGRDVEAGTGISAGIIQPLGGSIISSIGNITIGGSLAGSFFATGSIGGVQVGGSLAGGLTAGGNGASPIPALGKVKIVGSMTGILNAFGDIRSVKIGGDLAGRSFSGNEFSAGSGIITADGRIGRIVIGGSIIAGVDASSSYQREPTGIHAGDDIGSLTVRGSLIGRPDIGEDASLVVISARGQQFPTASGDRAIGSIAIGGSVEYARVLAGFTFDSFGTFTLAAANANASIGAVKVGGNWVASSLVAGVRNLGTDGLAGGTGGDADNVNFGDSHDFAIGARTLVARIASITIGGLVSGTSAGPIENNLGDHFGFVAQQIGKFKAAGYVAKLKSLPGDPPDLVELAPLTGDVTLHEV